MGPGGEGEGVDERVGGKMNLRLAAKGGHIVGEILMRMNGGIERQEPPPWLHYLWRNEINVAQRKKIT